MSLNFGFTVSVRSGHHRHPNTVEAAELLQECIHFFGPLCIYIYIYLHASRHSIFLIYYTNCGHRLSTNCVLPNSVVIMDLIDCFSTFSSLCINRRPLRSGSPTLATSCGFEVVFGQLLARVTIFNALSLLL